MNDLVDGSKHCDWIPDSSYCFRVRPITRSLACLYGNLLNGYQGPRPKMFTQSLPAVGGENYMVCGCLVAARITVGGCRVFVYDLLGSFLSLLLRVITNKSLEHHKMADSGNNGRHGERSRTGIVLVHVTKMIRPRRL